MFTTLMMFIMSSPVFRSKGKKKPLDKKARAATPRGPVAPTPTVEEPEPEPEPVPAGDTQQLLHCCDQATVIS